MNRSNTLQQLVGLIGIAAFLMGCVALTNALSTPAAEATQSVASAQPEQPTVTQLTVPNDWKLNVDPTGQCQVATPPDWQMGTDFFLEAEKAAPPPIEGIEGSFPPSGLALWGVEDITDLPPGHRFQIRTSLVIGEKWCSIWRIKAETDFTPEETAVMEQVGKTLQEVP